MPTKQMNKTKKPYEEMTVGELTEATKNFDVDSWLTKAGRLQGRNESGAGWDYSKFSNVAASISISLSILQNNPGPIISPE